ncbi:MAG: glucans biosynthesis glucosyltransferase MdoH [Hyphomicrobiales bacterium]|nr:glucans biosynthesis glucosyltransferase MdoH [Hyphomicrobiales bacterium]
MAQRSPVSDKAPLARDAGDAGSPYPAAMPPAAPLAMPTQRFDQVPPLRHRPAPAATPVFARIFVFGMAVALTAFGTWQMYEVVALSQVTTLEWLLVILFAVNFSWIALAFSNAWLGFAASLAASWLRPPPVDALDVKTALLMPVYNEEPSRIIAALQAMLESLIATGEARHFDCFILSDSTDPDIFIAEERALLHLRARLGPHARVYYRHRALNRARKAGNIADFVEGWGAAYPHMIVLDADSLMEGQTLVAMARAMAADPDAGIIQTLPLIINRNTMFARLQQFAARVYGPLIATGLATWSGRDGNYWGHNAIIRTAAFAAYCGLPALPGKAPFGGHVLSHDFVEAALIRRAGYSVTMLPHLGGSYEESPPSLIDIALRDRRWAQGNLQHMRIVGARGLAWPTRQHFITGIMAYLASPLWLAQLLIGVMLALQAHFIRPEYFAPGFPLYPTWPRFDPVRALHLFEMTMAVLLTPKFLGLVLGTFDKTVRRGAGGMVGLWASGLFEILLSALLSPIMMLIQTGSVMQILRGRDSGWNPQRRGDGTLALRDIIGRHRGHVALGLLTLGAGWLISPALVAWMSPTILGLLLAIPLSWASGQASIGLGLRRIGLLQTPEERSPPTVVQRANDLTPAAAPHPDEALRVIHGDAAFARQHEMLLPQARPRQRGDISADRALAIAKLTEAATIDEACAWLNRREITLILHDRALLALVARLA